MSKGPPTWQSATRDPDASDYVELTSGFAMSEVPALSALKPADADRLLARAVKKRFEPGETIISKGDEGDTLYIIKNGTVRVPVIDTQGRHRFTAVMGEGELFGEMALLTDRPRAADVIVSETGHCECYVLDVASVNELMHEHPSVARFLTEILGKRLLESDHMRQIGKYQLIRPLGLGGMARVFEGYQTGLDRRVAVKMLPHELIFAGDFVARFQQEAQMIAELRHPNIVEVFDTENAFATYFIVMELLSGEDLYQLIDRSGVMPAEQAREILRQVASALRYAHSHGVVHRDIKPSNVFIERNMRVKLLDFGIAARMAGGPGGQVQHNFSGTPAYAAPEVFQGKALDARSDIYSMGIMAYCMMCGELPFKGKSAMELSLQHLKEPLPDLTQSQPSLPSDMLEFVARATMKDPRDRFADCTEVLRLLEGGEPIELRSESAGRGLTALFDPARDAEVAAIMADAARRLSTIPGVRLSETTIPAGAGVRSGAGESVDAGKQPEKTIVSEM